MLGQHSFSQAHERTGLAHLSYHCPGLHGPGAAKQDIQRRSFRELLGEGKPIMRIPPFQRAYCWDDRLAAGWWRDCRKGSHSAGKAIFCPVPYAASSAELQVIDGQQRLTTVCLLVTAIRDAALRIALTAKPDAALRISEIVSTCDKALFHDVEAAQVWMTAAREKVRDGQTAWDDLLPTTDAVLPFLALAPSLRDRAPFAQLLTAGYLDLALATGDCPMVKVKEFLDRAVSGHDVKQLLEDTRFALDGMSVMTINIVDPPRGLAQQVYQWAQEKSLGVSLELNNPTPGVFLSVSDLVRNLLLAPLLDSPAEEMEAVLRNHWLPLEVRFDSPQQFDALLARFVEAKPQAAVSEAAAPLLNAAKGMDVACPGCELSVQLRLYGRFLSEYDAMFKDSANPVVVIAALSRALQNFADGGQKDSVRPSACRFAALMAPPSAPKGVEGLH